MELTILGSGTVAPSRRRAAPGYLLRAGADRVVIDSGPGTLSRLLSAGVRHDEVTHILYTHNHLDHTGELAPWLFLSRIPSTERRSPLTIAGSAGFMKMLSSLREVYGHWLDAASYTLNLVTLDAGRRSRVAIDGWSLEAFPVNHIESSIGYRITDESTGRTLVCTGDTAPCEGLAASARGADLLLIEASSPDPDPLPGHLTPSLAGTVAREAGARKVVLTHFYPACDEADMLGQLSRAWDGEAVIAEDGMRIEV